MSRTTPRGPAVRRRSGLVLGGVAAAVVLALVVGLVVLGRARAAERARDDAARAAADDLAAAWTAGDPAAARTTAGAAAVAEQYTGAVEGLGGAVPAVEVTGVTRASDDSGGGAAATADLTVSWPFGWSYASTAPLAPTDADDPDAPWATDFSPAVVHPALQAGEGLRLVRSPGGRGEVLGRDGAPLVSDTPVVEVGVQPSRATDVPALAARLAELLDVDAAALAERITTAEPEAFVPVVTLRRADYDPLREQLQPLPGTVFREAVLPLAPTREFARALLGTVGPATQDVVAESAGRVLAGDTTGLSGLQRDLDAHLAGTAGTAVRVVRAGAPEAGAGEAAGVVTEQAAEELFAQPAVDGADVALTLDAGVQRAADAALAAAGAAGAAGNGNASLVAVDVPTGDVLAVANTPAGGGDRALTGTYPPGSTFKAVATLALLGTGLDPGEVVPCPETATVQGRSFRNFEGGALGDVPFATDFAQSCNTAFVGLSQRLDAAALAAAGTSVGLGGDWDLGTPAYTGSVPTDGSAVDVAATTIGQGEALVSPVAMAAAVATIARGSWTAPRLVLQPPAATASEPAADAAPDPGRLGVVRDLMREVAVSGTAAALADVPGAPVHAKTGTAEYGGETPPRTHAWTIGFQGDVAFALVVEDGRSGGAVAVPVAEAFLRGLAG